ncbi:MAG: hypothetical protein ACOCUQ_02580 [Bacteroidota bacterium]
MLQVKRKKDRQILGNVWRTVEGKSKNGCFTGRTRGLQNGSF